MNVRVSKGRVSFFDEDNSEQDIVVNEVDENSQEDFTAIAKNVSHELKTFPTFRNSQP
jgi:hypothetical protein